MSEAAIQPILLSVPQLKERGWTPALIKKFLGKSDAQKCNPYYRTASPMHLYDAERVQSCEQTEAWQQARDKAVIRSEAGKTVAAKKAVALIKEAECLSITVRRLSLEAVVKKAIESYNVYHSMLYIERGHDYEPADRNSDPAFLERITVNYIRHHLTEYDDHLEELAGRIGVHEATKTIRRRIYAEIASVYPEYAEECKRQLQYRHGEEQ